MNATSPTEISTLPRGATGKATTPSSPYWVAYRNLRETKRERYMLSLNLGYELMKWSDAETWNLMGRVRTDHTAIKSTDKRFASTDPTLDMGKNAATMVN